MLTIWHQTLSLLLYSTHLDKRACRWFRQEYLDKSFYKTASLIAASCRSSAIFSGVPEEAKAAMYEYGRHLGLAFQIVDDILDFTRTTEQLGKPQVCWPPRSCHPGEQTPSYSVHLSGRPLCI